MGLSALTTMTPSRQMTKFHCRPLPLAKVAGTVWVSLHRGDEKSETLRVNDIDLNWAEIEQRFHSKTRTDQPPISQKPVKVELVDSKRAYNTAIGLAQFKTVAHSDIRRIVDEIFSDDLDHQQLVCLCMVFPTAEEVELVREHKGPLDELGHVERFFLDVGFPSTRQRLQIAIFQREFGDLAQNITTSLDAVRVAAESIHESKPFRSLLAVILRLSNYLNHGSRIGNAYGFDITDICKLAGVKSVDNQQSLLEYLLAYIVRHQPHINAFKSDLATAVKASRVEEALCVNKVRTMQEQIALIEDEMRATAELKEGRTPFPEATEKRLGEFLAQARQKYGELQESLETSQRVARGCAQFFGCDPSLPWEEVFAVFCRFLQVYERCEVEMTVKEKSKSKHRCQNATATDPEVKRTRREETMERLSQLRKSRAALR